MLNGRQLQFQRIYRGMTQKYIADCIGVTSRWIGKVENENVGISQEVYDKWILALNGGLKPTKKKKEKVED